MNITYSVDPVQLLTLAVGTVLPVLVGLVTTRVTNSGVKGVLLAFLSALTGLAGEALTAAEAGQVYDLGRGLVTAFGVWVLAVSSHFGIWKPSGVADAVQGVGRTAKDEMTAGEEEAA